jgi:hypothetical protein
MVLARERLLIYSMSGSTHTISKPTPLEPHPMKSASVQKLGDFGEFSRLKDELVFYLDRGIRDLSSIASMARPRLEILTWR